MGAEDSLRRWLPPCSTEVDSRCRRLRTFCLSLPKSAPPQNSICRVERGGQRGCSTTDSGKTVMQMRRCLRHEALGGNVRFGRGVRDASFPQDAGGRSSMPLSNRAIRPAVIGHPRPVNRAGIAAHGIPKPTSRAAPCAGVPSNARKSIPHCPPGPLDIVPVRETALPLAGVRTRYRFPSGVTEPTTVNGVDPSPLPQK